MITIRFAGWISGRIVSLQPHTDIQKLLSNGNRIRIRISETLWSMFRGCFWKSFLHNHFWKSCTLHNHSFIIFRSIFSAFCAMTPSLFQRWADCEIFQSESNPDPQKFNLIQSWSTKYLKIISSIQSWSVHVKPCILFCLMRQNRLSLLAFPKFNKAVFILPSEAKALLSKSCHEANLIGIIGQVTRMIHLDYCIVSATKLKGSGYRTTRGSLSLTPYSTISCNVIVTHDENALSLVEA